MINLDSKKILERYIPLVEFIAAIVGDNCEVVLHDVTCPENSIIAIKNEHLSGRRIGGPLTDLVLKVMQSKSYKNKDFVANYKASGKGKTFRSSSYFIKNDDDEIIGVLCVNIDIEAYEKVKDIMNKLTFISQDFDINVKKQTEVVEEVRVEEQLYASVDDLLGTMIQEAVSEIDVLPPRMSSDEKMEVVRKLDNKGAFQLKGAVSEISKALEVSDPTVYRYLSKVKEQV